MSLKLVAAGRLLLASGGALGMLVTIGCKTSTTNSATLAMSKPASGMTCAPPTCPGRSQRGEGALALADARAALIPSSCPAECLGSPAANVSKFLVRFAGAPGPNAMARLNELADEIQPIDALQPADLYVVKARKPDTAMSDLRNVPGVAAVEPEQVQSVQSGPPPTPNDEQFSSQWNLHIPGATGANDVDVNAPEAWRSLGWPAKSLERYPVTVALLDTGVDDSLKDFKDRISACRANFANDTRTDDVKDEHGHGTAMASIIAAVGDNHVGIAGMMWGTTILPCKIANGENASVKAVLRCLRWVADLADNGVEIAAVNYSIGSQKGCSPIMEQEIRRLRERGILFVAAAGDDTGNNDGVIDGSCPWFPASFSVSNIIAVTTLDKSGNVQNRVGKRSVHIAAPGQSIPVLGPLQRAATTSPAAAHVTGLIALLKAKDPCLDWRAARNLVLAGGVPIEDLLNRDKIISNRRVRAWDDTDGRGSMTCNHQFVRRRLLPVDDTKTLRPGEPVHLKAISINCAAPLPVPVRVIETSAGHEAGGSATASTFILRDDGQPPDEVADDGEFAALWTPEPTPGKSYKLKFWNPDDPEFETEALTVTVGTN